MDSRLLISIAITLFSINCVYADQLPSRTKYEVCFTPNESCTKLIIDTIRQASTSVHMQAYSFTSIEIAKALLRAKENNVDVQVILDKSQVHSNHSVINLLEKSGINVFIDYKPAIAHNKIIIIDKKIVMTGSFNFTDAAQYKNTENVLIISNELIAKKYLENWNFRLSQSTKPNIANM